MGEVFVCAHNLSGLSPLSFGPVYLSRTAWQLDLWQKSFVRAHKEKIQEGRRQANKGQASSNPSLSIRSNLLFFTDTLL